MEPDEPAIEAATSDAPAVDDNLVTRADVVALNRAVLGRSAAFARIAGTVLIGVGIAGLAAVLFLMIRNQQTVQGGVGFGDSLTPGPGILERLTMLTTSMPAFVEAAAVIAFGFLLRVVADYTLARVGVSLTGYEAGDHFPPDPDDPDEADV